MEQMGEVTPSVDLTAAFVQTISTETLNVRPLESESDSAALTITAGDKGNKSSPPKTKEKTSQSRKKVQIDVFIKEQKKINDNTPEEKNILKKGRYQKDALYGRKTIDHFPPLPSSSTSPLTQKNVNLPASMWVAGRLDAAEGKVADGRVTDGRAAAGETAVYHPTYPLQNTVTDADIYASYANYLAHAHQPRSMEMDEHSRALPVPTQDAALVLGPTMTDYVPTPVLTPTPVPVATVSAAAVHATVDPQFAAQAASRKSGDLRFTLLQNIAPNYQHNIASYANLPPLSQHAYRPHMPHPLSHHIMPRPMRMPHHFIERNHMPSASSHENAVAYHGYGRANHQHDRTHPQYEPHPLFQNSLRNQGQFPLSDASLMRVPSTHKEPTTDKARMLGKAPAMRAQSLNSTLEARAAFSKINSFLKHPSPPNTMHQAQTSIPGKSDNIRANNTNDVKAVERAITQAATQAITQAAAHAAAQDTRNQVGAGAVLGAASLTAEPKTVSDIGAASGTATETTMAATTETKTGVESETEIGGRIKVGSENGDKGGDGEGDRKKYDKQILSEEKLAHIQRCTDLIRNQYGWGGIVVDFLTKTKKMKYYKYLIKYDEYFSNLDRLKRICKQISNLAGSTYTDQHHQLQQDFDVLWRKMEEAGTLYIDENCVISLCFISQIKKNYQTHPRHKGDKKELKLYGDKAYGGTKPTFYYNYVSRHCAFEIEPHCVYDVLTNVFAAPRLLFGNPAAYCPNIRSTNMHIQNQQHKPSMKHSKISPQAPQSKKCQAILTAKLQPDVAVGKPALISQTALGGISTGVSNANISHAAASANVAGAVDLATGSHSAPVAYDFMGLNTRKIAMNPDYFPMAPYNYPHIAKPSATAISSDELVPNQEQLRPMRAIHYTQVRTSIYGDQATGHQAIAPVLATASTPASDTVRV